MEGSRGECVTSVRASGCYISSRLPVTSLGQQCEGSPPPAGVCDVSGSVEVSLGVWLSVVMSPVL